MLLHRHSTGVLLFLDCYAVLSGLKTTLQSSYTFFPIHSTICAATNRTETTAHFLENHFTILSSGARRPACRTWKVNEKNVFVLARKEQQPSRSVCKTFMLTQHAHRIAMTFYFVFGFMYVCWLRCVNSSYRLAKPRKTLRIWTGARILKYVYSVSKA